MRLGVAGCGAVGSRIALSLAKELKGSFVLTALYDIDTARSAALAKRLRLSGRIVKRSIPELVAGCDVVAECVNSADAVDIITLALKAHKKILVMSVGRLFGKDSLFSLARRNRAFLVLPSGAIAGLDAIKAARLAGLFSVTLTSRKPTAGFKGNAFLAAEGVVLDDIKSDQVLFEGGVGEAVKRFPQNINVAAALALAVDGTRVKVRIIASPALDRNTHEIVCIGKSGTIRTVTENVPCPDNPKTSYLAVLSGIQALKQLSDQVRIGT
ncbi:MAG: DUF108 domain-containing protein [Candidatus Omnitrophica bacterium]|nr:DUF108 domain-containing protein [Candidatus Omnitrophota bacterium]